MLIATIAKNDNVVFQTTFATSRDVAVPRSDWFFVGQGDLTFRSMEGSGPAVEVSGDALADGNSLTSRAAFYTKGTFGDGWRLTASLDTGETLLSVTQSAAQTTRGHPG